VWIVVFTLKDPANVLDLLRLVFLFFTPALKYVIQAIPALKTANGCGL